jgi:type IX secretion system PorP/SprF family membrane protein
MKIFLQTILLTVTVLMLIPKAAFAQQDPNYTQYMYNTMSVNPAYAGSRDVLSATGLHRSLGLGTKGSPYTQTLAVHSPLKNEQVGLGLSIVNDVVGPASQTMVDVNVAYTIYITREQKISFGMKGGIHTMQVDFSQGISKDGNANDPSLTNINLFSPTIGTGLYYHTNNYYIGVAVPDFLLNATYIRAQDISMFEQNRRLHYYLIAGYVMELNERLDFKPAVLTKIVGGAPVAYDFSANFLLDKRIVMGAAYRLGASVSALLGFQANRNFYFGYAFDYNTSPMRLLNGTAHELMIRYEMLKPKKIQSPRFF